MIATRQEYREARKLVRENGRYAYRAYIPCIALARAMQHLSQQAHDDLRYRAWTLGDMPPRSRQQMLKAVLRAKYKR